MPKTRSEFWLAKIQGTKDRDMRNKTLLECAGWRVLELWECELEKDYEGTIANLVDMLMCDD